MTFKRLIMLLTFTGLAFALTACGPNVPGQGGAAAGGGQAAADGGEQAADAAPELTGNRQQIIVWGVNTLAIGSGNEEMIDAWNSTHPDIEIITRSVPGAPGHETQDLTQLVAAIAAGDAPDVAVLNAPFIMEVAARGALESLNDVISRTGFDLSQFYEYTIVNMTFEDRIWGLPSGVDTRMLYFNKRLFEEAGLDPNSPPRTWEQLLDYSERLTIVEPNGELSQIGFIPNFGNSWLYLFMLQNGGQMVSDDGRTVTLNTPQVVEALEFMVRGYDLLGGAELVNAYVTAFAAQGGANHPLLTGEVAMIIDGNWAIGTYARFGADMIDDIGFTYAPTPTGTDFLTWSGGWAFGVPQGVRDMDAAFEVMSWLVTDGVLERNIGLSAYNEAEGLLNIPAFSASRIINAQLMDLYVNDVLPDHVQSMIRFGTDLLEISHALPAHPLGQQLWAEHSRAIDAAIYRTMTPQEALDEAVARLQPEVDEFWDTFAGLD